jgi:coenzyme F420-reducing hydrogenase beta subunit
VPCFIKAVHLARRADPVLAERITHTLGLFCGHQKSAHLVDSFALQLDAPMREVRAVDYRKKDEGRPANWYRADLTLADGSHRAEDWMHLADGDWGAGFWQNPACDWCDDVVGRDRRHQLRRRLDRAPQQRRPRHQRRRGPLARAARDDRAGTGRGPPRA